MGRKPRDLVETIELAHSRLDAWDLAGARLIYLRVLRGMPSQVDALYGMARIKLESGNVSAAVTCFSEVVDQLDSHQLRHAYAFARMVRFHYGRALFAARRFDEARAQWETVRNVEPTALLDSALRRALAQMGQAPDVVSVGATLDAPLKSTVCDITTNAPPLLSQVEAALERGEYQLALGSEAILHALCNEQPAAAPAALLASIQMLRGANAQAWETVVPFLKTPGSASTASRFGHIAYGNARWADARDAYLTALALRDHGPDWLGLARASVHLGDARGACEGYLNARTFLGDFRPVLPELRQLLHALGLPHEAQELSA